MRTLIALGLLASLGAIAFVLHGAGSEHADGAFSLVVGAGLGLAFERGRFCFFCISRDAVENRDSSGLFAILTALAVGAVGYAVVFSLFVPDPSRGRLPPEAHIGPVSIALVIAAAVFALGVALSHGCIGGHLYRIGQGSVRSIIALAGVLIGFGVGFWTWNGIYLSLISGRSATWWLPQWLGYTGSIVLTLAVLGAAALALLSRLPAQPARPARRIDLARVRDTLVVDRWPALVTGAIVGVLGVALYLKVEPIGVTAQLGSLSRTALDSRDAIPSTLHGLDTFAGCATVVGTTILANGWLVIGLVVASFAAALAGGRFSIEKVDLTGATAALLGGVLLGWGAMTALGCTFGVLLSGTQAFAVSGWVFLLVFAVTLWGSLRLRLHDL